MGGSCSTRGGDEKLIQNSAGKSEGKKALGRPRHRWEGNIRMDVRGVEYEGVDWIHLAENRNQWRVVVNTVMNQPSGSIKGRGFLG
jgi:hypothetical protein